MQHELNLGDRILKLEAILKNRRLNSGQTWQVYKAQKMSGHVWYLGIRTSGPVETDHDYVERLESEDEARYLVNRPGPPYVYEAYDYGLRNR